MRFAIWAYSAAVALTALVTVALGNLFQNIFREMLGGRPLPRVTGFFVHLQWWVFIAALPFFIAAYWLTIRSSPTIDRTFAFAGAATLVMVFLFAVALVSVCVPFVTIISPAQ